jgi:hypothetical protein
MYHSPLFQVKDADARPAIFCDDVADLEFSRITIGASPSAERLVVLHQVRGALLDQVRSAGTAREMTKLQDSESVTISPRNQ